MTTRVVGEIRWKEPVTLDDLRFLKRHTRRPVKMTVIGPLTAAVRLADDYYPDEETLGMAVARALNRELRALQAIAASSTDQICLEYEQPGHEPDLLRDCRDKDVILGVLNLGTHEIESVERIAGRIRDVLHVVPPERLHLAPDCGMWFLPREVAFGKLRAMVTAVEIVRGELR